ncbi:MULTISPECIES: 4-hydroxybenzoate octaprenyltransferase [unclassified Minwuia]|jgi:4-hydroxybenzoate polyprenyltransferase|uniref:4-hydroxybenzoate octaprenyltransferase n=1 Tax=unclassified Minwuia TaxID=2618799 RepID=UPI0024797308|nr:MULTISPECIES: 4-hydroxybenzoate octaprenyltransferase [unclassified Minwuia]
MSIIADARGDNWVDRHAPEFLKPWFKLARFDRPVGTWLLLWPCWWSIILARPVLDLETLRLFVLFGLGALIMRGAGCTVNDIADRNFDGKVERTRLRPIPSGQVTAKQAVLWAAFLALLGLVILLQLGQTAIWLGVFSLFLVVVYPFTKRVTWWPQAWLGLTFNWGAVMGYAAAVGTVELPALLLYAGGFFWTMGYDTIYAHQDKEDDALIGVKSSARKLGHRTRPALWIFYGLTVVLWALAAREAGFSHWFLLGFAAVVAHLVWQVVRVDIDNSRDCLAKFKSNIGMGFIMLAALLMGGLA